MMKRMTVVLLALFAVLIPLARVVSSGYPGDEAQALLDQGQGLQQAGQLAEAIPSFQSVLSDYPSARYQCAWALLRRSECEKALGDNEKAFATTHQILTEYADVPSACALAQCKIGEEYVARAQLEEAEYALLAVADRYPEQQEAVLWAQLALTDCLAFQGRNEEALAAVEYVLSGERRDVLPIQTAWAMFKKGSVLHSMKRHAAAAQVLRAAAEEFGHLDRGLLFQSLVKLGEAQADDPDVYWADAVSTLRWLITEFPDARRECAWAQYKIASLHRGNAGKAEALAEYDAVWGNYPAHVEPCAKAALDVGDLYYRSGETEQARQVLGMAIDAYEGQTACVTDARLKTIECLWVEGRFSEIPPVATAVADTPRPGLARPEQAAEALYRMGRAYEAMDAHAAAGDSFILAIELSYGNPTSRDLGNKSLFRLGNAHVSVGDFAAAVDTYERLYQENPDDRYWQARARYCVATAARRAGRAGEAKEKFQSLHDNYPDTRFASLAMRQIRSIDRDGE